MSDDGFDEPPLPFAFSNPPIAPYSLPGPSAPDASYSGSSMLMQHVHEEIPPDESQLESQRMDMADEYEEDSDDEEAPNDLMIEMNPLLQAERTPPYSPNRLHLPPRPQQRVSLLNPRYPSDGGRRMDDIPRRTTFNSSPRARRMNGAPQISENPVESKERIKEDVLKLWSETENLDDLLENIYNYFVMKGFTAMLLSRATNLLILSFIIGFAVFLSSCVDYSLIGPGKLLADVIRNDCVRNVHGLPASFLILFSIWWLWQVIRLVIDTPKLFQMKLFYELILEIPESAMDTLTWREVILKITRIRDIPNSNPHGRSGLEKLDAHNIANRILRRENYLIAIFNKDILDLTVRFWGNVKLLRRLWNGIYHFASYHMSSMTRAKVTIVSDLLLGTYILKRFAMMAFLNLLFAPFLIIFLFLYIFFRYAEEYSKNPSQIGARQYSPFAWWKFREFNELPHLYQERLNRSYKKAAKYMEQFPKEKIIILARFEFILSFVTGSFAAALAVLTLVDNQFIDFEITPQRSVFFYIGVFGGIAAAARAMIPEENQVFEPEKALREVAEDTHYLPESWKGKLHTEAVKTEFAGLFDYKVVLFLQEIASVVLAPFILYYSLPKCSGDIIDFFREFTVHVDSLGYVCSFAGANQRLLSKEGKMEQSFLFFKANNPEWEPDHEGSQYRNLMTRTEASTTGDFMASMLLRPPRFGQSENQVRPISDSIMAQSEIDFEDRPLGLFGLLDALYETNSRGFSRVA
ncbi:autophagy protein Apg9-domain-containing protein [Chytridium lagenaria]|nr:autophagy protein Apg9-domain-containing protein [Chytridium lagenaria]